MKAIYKFCSFSLAFLVLIGCYYVVKVSYLAYDNRYQQTIPGREIYWAIDKSKKKTHKKKLVLGDSTGNQFFNNQLDDDSIYSLACNQSIGMVGHYILLNNYLQAGNKPDSVYLVFRPFSFANNLDDNYTYHYFLKPLYTEEYIPMMTETVKKQITHIPYFWLCHFPTVQTSTWAPKYEHEERCYSFLSPISREYIEKMDSLSKVHNFELFLIPTIVSESLRDKICKIDTTEIYKTNIADKLQVYLSNIEFLPDTCFWDGTHLTHPLIYKKIIIEKMR